MKKCILISGILWACTSFVAISYADTIILKDGTRYDGEILTKDAAGKQQFKTTDGTTLSIPADTIKSIELNSNHSTTQRGDTAWDTLLFHVKKLDDLAQILEAYDKFIAEHPDSLQISEAKAARFSYKQMQDDHYIKFRGNWMSPAKAETLTRQAIADAETAHTEFVAGHLKEAEEKINSALQADNQNYNALVLASSLRIRQNNIPAAREYLAQIIALKENDPLARNNLAIVSFKQNRQPEGMIHFTKALQAAPENRQIIDNIAIALTKYTGSTDNKIYRDLIAPYKQAESRMATAMAAKPVPLYHLGTTWVSKADYDKYNDNIKKIKDSMATLENQFTQNDLALKDILDKLKTASDNADTRTSDAIRYQLMINQNTTGNNGYWAISRDAALQDADYYKRQKSSLERQRDSLQAAQNKCRATANKLKEDLRLAQQVNDKNVMRYLELGEVVKPPEPVPLGLAPLSTIEVK